MVASPVFYHPVSKVVLYTGSNGADLVAYNNSNPLGDYLNGQATLVSESGGSCVISFTALDGGATATITLNAGDYFSEGTARYSPATWANGYRLDAFSTPADILAGVKVQEEVAAVAIPALLLNGSTSVTATLSGAFPSTSYDVRRRVFAGASVLSSLAFAETGRTSSSITYTVTASGVATAAAMLLVDAYKLVVA